MRNVINFNQDWYFSKVPTEPGQATPNAQPVTLPHTWNAVDGQDGGNDYWRGTASYCKRFAIPELPEGSRVFLEINGAAMTAEVFLNGKLLAHHEGGYSTFRVDLTDALAEENELCVTVDNSANDRVYPQKADFTFYGGLYRNVNLIIVPQAHFELMQDGGPGIKVTPIVDLEKHSAQVTVETWQTGGQEVRVSIGELSRTVNANGGYTSASSVLDDPHLWDGIDDPYLYTVTATLLEHGQEVDEISARFGCRAFRVDPEEGFFLNGRHYPLCGAARHQDREGLGNALTMAEHREDIEIMKEMGANTVRLAHYQHAQEFYDLCDENGLIVWAEIPYITAHLPNGWRNTLSQMRELVTQAHYSFRT